jgi:hypothetical protein
MSRSRFVPPRQRLAIFLMVFALVATLSPGLVLAAEGAPHPIADTITTAEGVPAMGNVLANDTNNGQDPMTVTGVGTLDPSIGTLDIDPDGDYTFTPAADWNGSTTTTYTVTNASSKSKDGIITISVSPSQDPPVANDDTIDVDEDTPTDVTTAILANDTDVDGDTLVVTGVSSAAGGSVDLTAGVVTFTPAADLCGDGEGSFDYDISDGNGGSSSSSVSVDIACVNNAPVAVDDTGAVDFGAPATDFVVLANDTDIDTAHGDLTVASASVSASAGAASVVGGQVRFTPAVGFSGLANITYVVSDGDLQDSGTLAVTVGPDNIAPVAAKPTIHFGTGRVDETAPLLISWSATDIGTGVASYEVQVSVAGGTYTNIYTGAGTSVTKFYRFSRTLSFRVRATDGEGNVSGWATAATRRLTAYQRNSTKLTYTGTWTKVTSAGSSGTGYLYTKTLGKRATLTFSGREVIYVAPKSSGSGYVKVSSDGKSVGRFNLRSSTTKLGQIIARKVWTANGKHTMRITNDQSGRRTSLDAFIVLE